MKKKLLRLPAKAGPLKPSVCPVCGDTRGICKGVNVKIVPQQIWQRPRSRRIRSFQK